MEKPEVTQEELASADPPKSDEESLKEVDESGSGNADSDDVEESENFDFEDNFGEVVKDTKPETFAMEIEKQIGSYYGHRKLLVLPKVGKTHRFINESAVPICDEFNHVYQREMTLLREHLPDGIFVRSYEDRMDLFSALIMGPQETPYEGGLFAFDIKLPNEYPLVPPHFHFHSFTKSRLNPKLHADDGTVSMPLLGTAECEHESENWSSEESSLLQILMHIQETILVQEPYYIEYGFAKPDTDDQAWDKRSRLYNENVILLLLQATAAELEKPPLPWNLEISFILKEEIPKLIFRIEHWIEAHDFRRNYYSPSKSQEDKEVAEGVEKTTIKLPCFPLYPIRNSEQISTAISELRSKHEQFCDI